MREVTEKEVGEHIASGGFYACFMGGGGDRSKGRIEATKDKFYLLAENEPVPEFITKQQEVEAQEYINSMLR